jgi:outer membrane protein
VKKSLLFFLCLSLLLTAGPAWALDGLYGLGVGVAPDYEGSEDTQAVPMLMFNHNYDSGRFVKLLGPNLRVNLLASNTFSLGPVVNYRAKRNDVDNDQVDRMDEIDAAFEAGVFAGYKLDNLMLTVEYLTDVSDTHDGSLAKASASYRWKVSESLAITPGVSVTYADSDYMDTYFGVNSGNVGSSSLPNYSADSGVKDVGASITAHFTPWQHWGIMAIGSFSKMQGDAKDSPIVDDEGEDSQFFAGLMATYRWSR